MNLQLYSPCFRRSFTLQVPSSVVLVELYVILEAEKSDHLLGHGERSPVGKLAGNADIVRLTVPDKLNLAHLCNARHNYGLIIFYSNSITYFLRHIACGRLIVGPFSGGVGPLVQIALECRDTLEYFVLASILWQLK